MSGQVGSAYLRFKIDPRGSFTFTGKVDIGDKYEGHTVGGRPGGDGVGFVFHTGNVDTIGQSGRLLVWVLSKCLWFQTRLMAQHF